MPTSPFLFHTGAGVIAAISLLGLVASVLTLVASSLLLIGYRRTVARWMSKQAREAGPRIAAAADSEAGDGSTRMEFDNRQAAVQAGEDRLRGLMISGPRRQARKYAAAGMLFALVIGLAVFLAFSQTQINTLRAARHPLQFLFMFWTCVWPSVLTINVVAAEGRLVRWLTVLAYFVVLAVLAGLASALSTEPPVHAGNLILPAWSGESPARLLGKWSLSNLPPTILTLAFRHRRARAVAPLVLAFMTIVSVGILAMWLGVFTYIETSAAVVDLAAKKLGVSTMLALVGFFVLLLVIASLLFGALGWRLLAWLRGAYQRKAVSDQSLAIDAMWVVFASFYAAMLAFGGPGWALAALVGFVVFKLAVRVGNMRLRSTIGSCGQARALLVLRVFALGGRSEALFDEVSRRWRYVGDVRLIAGTDLALSTVAPHRFLAFVAGRLRRLFIADDAALDRSLAELDTRRDADGRFRINDFFCHADTWQRALSRLVAGTDVVLMDLRSFRADNAGCVFEIKELLSSVPLARLVVVVDMTTDMDFLNRTLTESWPELRSSSPNIGLSPSDLKPFELRSPGRRQIQQLLHRLCTAG